MAIVFILVKCQGLHRMVFASMDRIAACQRMICFSEFSLGENIDLKLEVARSLSNSHLLRK